MILWANRLGDLTPPLLGEGFSGSPFPCREGGWGVRLKIVGQSFKSLAISSVEQYEGSDPLLN